MAPRRVLVPKQVGVASLRCGQKRKIPSVRKDTSHFAKKIFLNLTPCSLQSPRLWHFVLCCDGVATLAEQSAAAVLMSKLLDTAALDYLRRRTPCVLRRKGGKSFLLRQKKKDTERPKGHSVSLAEKKGFEPSRRLPDLHP